VCPKDKPPLISRKAALHLPGMDNQAQAERCDSCVDQAHDPDNSRGVLKFNRLKIYSASVDLQNHEQRRSKEAPIPLQEQLHYVHRFSAALQIYRIASTG
jgi:hypothetical protein